MRIEYMYLWTWFQRKATSDAKSPDLSSRTFVVAYIGGSIRPEFKYHVIISAIQSIFHVEDCVMLGEVVVARLI